MLRVLAFKISGTMTNFRRVSLRSPSGRLATIEADHYPSVPTLPDTLRLRCKAFKMPLLPNETILNILGMAAEDNQAILAFARPG